MRRRYLVYALVTLVACGEAEAPDPADADSAVPEAPAAEFTGDPEIDANVSNPLPDDPSEALPQPPLEVGADSPREQPGDSAADPTHVGDAPEPEERPAGTDASEILARAERAYSELRSLQADFVQEVYVPLLDTTKRSRGRIYHRRPDLFAMRFTDPEGDLIVADGGDVWMYYPSTDPKQVMRSHMGDGGQRIDLQREFLSDATERYEATLDGTESVGGRTAHALTLVPRGPSPYRRIRLWIDVEDALVRRFEIVEENDSERRLEMSNLRPNADIPDSIFEFTPPPGAQVFEP